MAMAEKGEIENLVLEALEFAQTQPEYAMTTAKLLYFVSLLWLLGFISLPWVASEFADRNFFGVFFGYRKQVH